LIVSRQDGRIGGISVAGPAGGTVAAYCAFLMKRGVSVHDFSRFTEVHPSSDGIHPLAKYATGRLKRTEKNQRND
ncbi:MAG TPA: NAD(P)/FAD-dependent oxidoreductase, partial [Methanolinea sp.]|nr:NAD(P)/FAD-dependent oxidoreductase [Methanolinea sp.]HPC56200.1 NAD(P)/FAD-dependent oxidoreductase [Methanolinea sp.]HQE86533.1 NAD(P)/FAD-dependent oxidoreductase [Methanolinea sp.]